MSDEGRVRWERDGRVLKITIDNPAKKNAFSPEMMQQLSQALTELDRDDELWAGVVCAEGDHFTAGLDMPKFFGPGATARHARPKPSRYSSATLAPAPGTGEGVSTWRRCEPGRPTSL